MRRLLVSVVLVVAMVLATSGIAVGANALIAPHTQTHAHGVASSWTLTWGNVAPYFVVFYYGDGGSWSFSGNNTSANLSHTFWPCSQTIFGQELQVLDGNGGVANDFSYATEYGGNPC